MTRGTGTILRAVNFVGQAFLPASRGVTPPREVRGVSAPAYRVRWQARMPAPPDMPPPGKLYRSIVVGRNKDMGESAAPTPQPPASTATPRAAREGFILLLVLIALVPAAKAVL